MVAIDHYNVRPHNGEEYNIHFHNIEKEEHHDKAIVGGLYHGHISPIAVSAPGAYERLSNSESVYRKMCQAEVDATLKANGLAPSIKGTDSRKYLTESLDKVLRFKNNGVSPEQRANQKIAEFVVDKKKYQVIRQMAIPQENARTINPTADIFHYEGLGKGSKSVNLGIHKNNIGNFNKSVKDILVLNPKSPMVTNKYLRYISSNKFKVASYTFAVVFEGVNIGISIYQDGGLIGQHTVRAVSTTVGSTVGGAIGGAILSMVPGIGSTLGWFVGGMIGGFIGTKVGSLLCSYFYAPAGQGSGPPATEHMPLVYGLPECEFSVDGVCGAPRTEFGPNAGGGSASWK